MIEGVVSAMTTRRGFVESFSLYSPRHNMRNNSSYLSRHIKDLPESAVDQRLPIQRTKLVVFTKSAPLHAVMFPQIIIIFCMDFNKCCFHIPSGVMYWPKCQRARDASTLHDFYVKSLKSIV